MRPDDDVCSKWFEVRMRAVLAVVQHLFRSRADRCPPKIPRRYGYPRRAGALEGTADVEETIAGYGLRSSCGMGHAVRGLRLHSFTIAAGAR